MRMQMVKKIGQKTYQFEFEGNNLFDMVMESQKLSFADVVKCGLCSSDNLALRARRAGDTDEYKYTEVYCYACGASLTFGQRKEDSNTFFLRKKEDGDKRVYDWKPKYNPQGQQGSDWGHQQQPKNTMVMLLEFGRQYGLTGDHLREWITTAYNAPVDKDGFKSCVEQNAEAIKADIQTRPQAVRGDSAVVENDDLPF
jgi:hypothetical protein